MGNWRRLTGNPKCLLLLKQSKTLSIENAFDRIKAHQKEMEGRDIQYMMSFWVGGEALCHAVIAESTSVDTCREKIEQYVKSFLH